MQPIIPFEPIRSLKVPEGDQWIYQVKWDGVRILAYCDGRGVRLFNRKKNERTKQFPELTDPSAVNASSFIVDGEVIALAEDGKPSFHEVMRRDGIRVISRVRQAVTTVPIAYMVFDILYFNGEWVTGLPLQERQQLLAEVMRPNEHFQPVTSHPDGNALLNAIRDRDMEGIVSKDLHSTYALGGKDDRWVKVKNYGDVIAVIGGYRIDGGIVRAVFTGLYRDGELIYIGKVGMGKLTVAEWRGLTTTLMSIEVSGCPFANRSSDFKDAHWVKPVVTAKIQYSEWRQHEGRTMRQPSIQAIVDKEPEECVFEG